MQNAGMGKGTYSQVAKNELNLVLELAFHRSIPLSERYFAPFRN